MKKIILIFALTAILGAFFIYSLYIYINQTSNIPVNLVDRAKYYEKLSDNNDPSAMYELARLYSDGEGVEFSIEKSIKLIKKSAYLGDWRSLHALSRIYTTGRRGEHGFEIEPIDERLADKYRNEAISAAEKEANNGNPEALIYLATLYENGWKSFDIDPLKASELYAKAVSIYTKKAESGDSDAQYMLSVLYEDGKANLIESEEKATFWLRKSADQDHAEALMRLSDSIASPEMRLSLIERAAKLGDADAMMRRGDLYAYEGNQKLAILWFMKAYEQKKYDGFLASRIAYAYKKQNDYPNAIKWRLLNVEKNNNRFSKRKAFFELHSTFNDSVGIEVGMSPAERINRLSGVATGEDYQQFLSLLERFSSQCDETSKSTENECAAQTLLADIKKPSE